MIGTIDNKKYGKLLANTLPGVIETEEENDRLLQIVEKMMHKGADNFSPEEDKLFDLLVNLIEDFEETAYPMPNVKPHERIKYLLEERQLKQKDLLAVFGSEGVVSEIMNGKRPMTLKTAQKLSEFFNVPVELFVHQELRQS